MKTNKNAICITVYKNRCTTMLDMISSVENNFDVYIVAQKNDPELNEYYKYNAEVLTPDVTSIFHKREYVRNEMISRGYEGFFMIDDDVVGFKKITPESKRITSDTYKRVDAEINEVLNDILSVSEKYDCDFVSIMHTYYIGFQRPGNININKSINAGQFVYLRTNALKEYDLHYDESGNINEDVDMVIRLMQHGRNCATIGHYGYAVSNYRYSSSHMKHTNLYSDIEDIERMNMNNCVKHHIGIKLTNKGILTNVIRYNKYFNTFDLPIIDENVLNFCKNQNILGLKTYLKTIKDEKDSNRKTV